MKSIDIFTLAFYSLALIIGIFGIIGNILAFRGFQRLKKKTSTAFLFQALAIVDTLVIITVCTFECSSVLLKGKLHTPIGAATCDPIETIRCRIMDTFFPASLVLVPLRDIAILITIGITVILSITRLVAVFYPLHAKQWCSLGKFRLAVGVAILFSIAFNTPYFVQCDVEKRTINDTLHWTPLCPDSFFYYLILMRPNVYGFIPLTVISTITVCLMQRLRVQHKERATLGRTDSIKGQNANRVLIAIMIVFLVCSLTSVRQRLFVFMTSLVV